MRKLSEQFKIPGRSLPEVLSRFDGLVSRQQSYVGRKWGDPPRKVPAEVIANAIVLQFLDLDPADQDALLDRYVPELAELLRSDQPGQVVADQPVKHTAETPPEPAKTRRRSG